MFPVNNNCQPLLPKSLPNQPMYRPGNSRTPLEAVTGGKQELKPSEQQCICGHHFNSEQLRDESCSSVHYQMKPSTASPQQSSGQFLNFLRLMQLFPDVHPATLHTVLFLCKNNFFYAVDNLLYAKKYKQVHANRQNSPQGHGSNRKCNRYQPYSTNDEVNSAGAAQNAAKGSTTLGVQGSNEQIVPLDGTVKKLQGNQNTASTSGLNSRQAPEVRKYYRKTTVKDKVLDPVVCHSTDLLLVTSTTCKLPICPLSPVPPKAEELPPQTSKETENS